MAGHRIMMVYFRGEGGLIKVLFSEGIGVARLGVAQQVDRNLGGHAGWFLAWSERPRNKLSRGLDKGFQLSYCCITVKQL